MKLQSLLKTLMIASCSVAFAFSQAMASDSEEEENMVSMLPDDVPTSTAVVPHVGSSDSKALVPQSLREKRAALEERLAKARERREHVDHSLSTQVKSLNRTAAEAKQRFGDLEKTADVVADRAFDVQNKCALILGGAQGAIVKHIFGALKKAEETGRQVILSAAEVDAMLDILKSQSVAIVGEAKELIGILDEAQQEGAATVALTEKNAGEARNILTGLMECQQ